MPQPPPRRKAWIRPAGPAAAPAVLWTAGMLGRLTVRDGFVPASTLWYATSVVVLAAVAGLAGLSAGFDCAFATAGRGHHATWPVPCPLLAIDHVRVSRGLRVASCALPWTWRSDHLPVVVGLLPAGNPPATLATDR